MADPIIPSWTSSAPDRPVSPSKRQRTSQSIPSSQWAERVDKLSFSRGISDISFTSPLSDASPSSVSRAGSPTRSVRSRRIQLDYTSPAICFGPREAPRNSDDDYDSGDESDVGMPHRSKPSSSTLERGAARLSLEATERLLDAATCETPSIPPDVCSLIRRLSEGMADPVLDADTVSRIQRLSPAEAFPAPVATGATDVAAGTSGPRRNNNKSTLRHVCGIFEQARFLYAGSHDEAAWYPLIRTILIGPPVTSSTAAPFITHEEAQSRSVHTELLPKHNNKAIPTVKVDHLLQFNTQHRLIGPLYKTVFRAHPPSFPLSAFSDPVADKTFTCAIIEVKAPGGNFQEASYQLGVAAAAILERVQRLDPVDYEGMPVLGWIVHGHFWTLHVAYRDGDDSVRVLGPYPSGNTATYLGVYRLLHIVYEVKQWGREVYWPYLEGKLIKLCNNI